ncbi:MAG: hypothetical protein ABFS37_02005 [Acidobacteriota bacterium]
MTEIGSPSVTGPRPPVTFFIANEADVEGLRSLDPDKVLQHSRRGEFAWVVQTYLRLQAAGYPVALANVAPQTGLVVFHAKHKHLLAQAASAGNGLIFVGIRADNSAPLLADFEILQNGWFGDNVRRFPVTHWPQPGITPRDPGRGARVERIGYMGLIENLESEFQSDVWVDALSRLGIEWAPSMVRFREMGDPTQVNWEEYRDLDVLLAIRPKERALAYAKPASKLINAWRAGVPIMVGPEYPYRELRRSEDDFIEITNVATALEALQRLKSDPGLYHRMVSNGYRRAEEFTESKITQRWAELLFDTIPSLVAAQGLHWTHRLPLGLRPPVRRILRIVRRERSR